MENHEPKSPSLTGQSTPGTPTKSAQHNAKSGCTPESNSEEVAMAEFRRKHPDLAAASGNMLHRKFRLERGHKYFDSGDYNMYMAKVKSIKEGVPVDVKPTTEEFDSMGDDHPTPDSIPHKKYPPLPGVSKLTL